MIRKISFCLFLTLCFGAVSAQESASAKAPAVQEASVFKSVSSSPRDFASLKKDVESTVARLEELRLRRDAADGEKKAELAAQVNSVYEHLNQLRREVADFAIRTEVDAAQRRLEFERQQRSINLQHSQMQQRMLEQQRLARQQEQQRRLNRMNR